MENLGVIKAEARPEDISVRFFVEASAEIFCAAAIDGGFYIDLDAESALAFADDVRKKALSTLPRQLPRA